MRYSLHIAVALSVITTVSGAGTGTMSVTGGFVGGNGTISGAVAVGAAGSLYPGATVGTLPIDGDLDISAMADGGSGKLAFSLDTLAGPNDQITAAGTLTIGVGKLGFGDFVFTDPVDVELGTYTLITSSGIIGSLDVAANLRSTINGHNGTIAISGNNITLMVTEAIPPTLLPSAIVDDKSGNPVIANNLVTYTVTFNEDMDASTVTASDFGNAGTAAVTIGSVTETTATSGVFTVQATPTSAGTLMLQVNAGAELKDVAGNNLNTASAIVDDTTISVISIVDDKSGGPVDINALVAYTVTFSEDMDASTVTASDFENAGTALVSIGTVTETAPTSGTFIVQATPTTPGTLILQVKAGTELKDFAGNNLNTSSAMPDDTTLTVLTAYQTWANGYLPIDVSNTAGNNDGDSLTNLQEFAFGTNPTTTTSGTITYIANGEVTSPGLPVALNLSGGPGVAFRAVFGRRKDYVVAGLTYTVQFSAGLDIWVDSHATPLRLSGISSSGPIDAVAVPYPLFINTARGVEKPTFFRIAVSHTP